ncbi:uncharacterized protein LOC111314339 isoform X8 [Durio zibethinus]|uniref:Uncharacterized protein LOC111314339 isoform X8 n=1 Tax=Durio zibethinus TaxID=66656 RepID=A0A6P6B2B5_DURZI|nr:uncharacterized protein LOC111314339 isoform X8 [Durio zibethinus]
MDYTSAAYNSTGSSAYPSEDTGDPTASGAPAAGNYAASGGDRNSAGQEGQISAIYDRKPIGGSTDENAAGVGNTAVDASKATGYNSSLNGNVDNEAQNAATVENGNVFYNVGGSSASPEFVDGSVPPMSGEEDRLWSIVRANSLNFNAWTTLIEETEKVAENNILKIRKVYDAFLAEYPLCYGYWKKYADHEAHIGSMDKVVEVYERAVQEVTYSVDIWVLYCAFAIETYGDLETIRRLFERGLAYVGTDYLSFPLWDKYIEYEYMHQEWSRLAVIYTRILENPNQHLDRYFNSFKELAGSRPISELRTAEEAAAASGVASEADGPVNEGEVHPDAAEETPKPVSSGLVEAEELEKYVTVTEELYKKAKEFDSKILGFETAIRRPYFHVQPLNVAELENWHNYLDFLEREGDFNKVSGNAEKAREILTGALDQVQLSKPFLEALIHFETILPRPRQIDYLESLVDKFIALNMDGSAADREDLSSIFLEFLSLFGDVQSIKRAEDRQAKLFLPHRSMSELRKRHAEDFLSSDKTKLAKSYSGAPSPGQSLMGAYPNALNQWPAGYGAQPQIWPPTSQVQAQAQPWTTGYSQQAAYGACSSYGSNYATPQVPTSIPRSASYGAYPTTYPVQTFPQQNYAQASAPTALIPAQQPAAAVPQTYYGTYY